MTMGKLPSILLAALLVCACGGEPDEPEAQAPAPPADAAPAPEYQPPSVRLSPTGGPPGTAVHVSLDRLVMRADVEIGFGDMGQHVVLATAQASDDGQLSTQVTVPADARAAVHYFFVSDARSGQPLSTPTPFLVTGADGRVAVDGRITEEGVECPAMRGDMGVLYTLAGADPPPPGTRVTVRGTIAQMSTCQQGVTIDVETIRVQP